MQLGRSPKDADMAGKNAAPLTAHVHRAGLMASQEGRTCAREAGSKAAGVRVKM